MFGHEKMQAPSQEETPGDKNARQQLEGMMQFKKMLGTLSDEEFAMFQEAMKTTANRQEALENLDKKMKEVS